MKSFNYVTMAILSLSSVALAQDEAELFGQLDKNNDGIITANEVGTDKQRFFDRLVRVGDKNEDGKLSRSEFQAATEDASSADTPALVTDSTNRDRRSKLNGATPEQLFARFDTNKDGKLTRQELPDGLSRILDVMRKESVTIDDLKQARQRRDASNGQTRNNPKAGAERFSPDAVRSMFKRLDENANGKLEAKEIPERMQPTIKRMLEGLGKEPGESLTLAEFTQFAARVNQSMRPTDRPTSDRPASQSRTPQGSNILSLLDKNRDGALDRDELSRAASLLETLDKNKDGKLDIQELLGSRRSGQTDSIQRGSDRRATSTRDKTDRPAASDRSSTALSDLVKRGFTKIDRDGDGSISRAEATEKLRPHFDKADSNGDGKVQLEELAKFLETVRRNK